MRPSSGGSSLMSNWLEPPCARAAMAIGRPAIETAAAGVAVDAAVAVCAVAVFVAMMPKVGKFSVAALTVLVAVWAPGEAAFGPFVAAASRRAVMRFAAGEAAVSPGDDVTVAVAACCAEASPDDGALAGALGEEAGCAV